jgi:multidrug efflux pump subunit AcrB
MTLLGVVSLAGIVINNAIVLIDRINIEIDQNGLPPDRAIVESAMRRLRPILLTTATTFGLMFATVLTLGVVPVLYSLFFRVKFGEVKQ